jgi:hypothetical protein
VQRGAARGTIWECLASQPEPVFDCLEQRRGTPSPPRPDPSSYPIRALLVPAQNFLAKRVCLCVHTSRPASGDDIPMTRG